MGARKFAPRNGDGTFAYVVSTSSALRNKGIPYTEIVYATSLGAAKAKYGWTRELHTYKSVRRATVEDLRDQGRAS